MLRSNNEDDSIAEERFPPQDKLLQIVKMNGLFVISCLLLAASIVRADIVDTYMELHREQYLACARENGYTDENPQDVYQKDRKTGAEEATCLRSCTLKTMGMVKDSKVNLEPGYELVESVFAENPQMIETLKKAMAECAENVKDVADECKMAYLFIDCFLGKQ